MKKKFSYFTFMVVYWLLFKILICRVRSHRFSARRLTIVTDWFSVFACLSVFLYGSSRKSNSIRKIQFYYWWIWIINGEVMQKKLEKSFLQYKNVKIMEIKYYKILFFWVTLSNKSFLLSFLVFLSARFRNSKQKIQKLN